MSPATPGTDAAARADSMRSLLIEAANGDEAARLAGDVANLVNARLNDAGVSKATSLLSRALVARAIAVVLAEWWSDVSGQPLPVTAAAIASIIEDLPPQFDGESFVVDG